MSEGQEYTARTVQQALVRAADDLHVSIDELHYEVVDEKRRFLGFGGRQVRIRVVPVESQADGERRDRRAAREDELPKKEREDRPRAKAPEPRRDRQGESSRRGGVREDGPSARRTDPRDRDVMEPRRSAALERDDTREDHPDSPVEPSEAEECTGELVRLMGMDLDVAASWTDEHLLVELEGPDTDFLLRNAAEPLDALQYLVNSCFSRATGTKPRIVVDCEGYRRNRQDEIIRLAMSAADDVRRYGEKRTLDPMNPYDRRAVHMALSDDRHVRTYSVGDGLLKRVIIAPASGGSGRSSGRRGNRLRR